MKIDKDWTTDWTSFIKDVAASFDRGLSDKAVTAQFTAYPVVWQGRIKNKKLTAEYDPGIEMQMPRVRVHLKDGRTATVDYLYLHINGDEIKLWEDIPVGENVRFRTRIASGNVVFAGIEWGKLDEKRGVIMLGTEGASLIERIRPASYGEKNQPRETSA